MATYREMLSDWLFDSTSASSCVSSNTSKITLDSAKGLIALVPQNTDVGTGVPRVTYPTDTGLYIQTGVITVPRNKTWQKIQVDSVTPRSLDRTESTSVKLRLYNGTSHYYWNGAAWATTTTSWNTPTEINTNLSSWTGTSIGFVVNLLTTDRTITPTLSRIRVLHSVDLPSYYEDIVFDTVVAGLQSNIRPYANLAVESDGTATVNLGSYDLETDYSFTGVDAVFNDTTDSVHASDLLSSYNPISKVITLTTSPTAGDVLFIRYKYAPEVAYNASQDYQEIASIPSLVFDSINFVDLGEAPSDDYIMDTFLTPPQAVILPAPRRTNVLFTLDAYAPLMSDLYLLQESVLSYLQNNRVINSAATGIAHTLRVTEQFAPAGGNLTKDLQQSRMAFQIENMYMWVRPSYAADASTGTGFGVDKVSLVTQVGHTSHTSNITED